MADTSLQSKLGIVSKRPSLVTEPTPEEDYQAFAYGRVGVKAVSMLCFVKTDGFHLALPYIDLRYLSSMSPSDGFDMEIGPWKISISGRNLWTAFRYIREHRLAELVEASRTVMLSLPETESLVEQLDVKLR